VVPPSSKEPAPMVGRTVTSAPGGTRAKAATETKAPTETAKPTPPVTSPAPRVASVPSSNRGSVPVLAEVQSQRRTYRVGWLDSGRATAPYQDLVKQGLVGYPRDVTFEYRSAEGQAARLQEFATELVQLKVDVVFAVGNSAILAARQTTSTIPIVMVGSDTARPDGSSPNVTGVTYSSADLARRWVDLLKEIGPLSRVAVVYGGDSASRAELATIQAAVSDAGARIQAYAVNESDALGGLFARPSAERA